MCDNNRYSKIQEIGRGVYSRVYSLGQEGLVCKSIPVISNGYVSSCALWDIAIPTSMRHRNICKIEKVFFTEEEVQIVMPRYSPISEINIEVVYKLLHALRYLHNNNVIHRDIKRDNIMMDNGEPIIIDFSISRIGVLPHMNPSSYTDGCRHKSVLSGKYGYEADIYALGMTFLSVLLNYTQNELSKIWLNSAHTRLLTKGVLGEIVRSMIDEDNIPSLEHLLSHHAFKDMEEPICDNPIYRPVRTVTPQEEARIGMSIYIYSDLSLSISREMMVSIYRQGPESLSSYRREMIDLASSILDDNYQYDLSMDLLSLVSEGMHIQV